MRILLADDSVTAQNMGKKILSEAGHEVVCVSNGAAALKKVSEQEPDLVILDIYMPGYSGLEVCQRLKEGPGTANLPVVLTVGKLEPFRKEDAQRVRAEALIVKPFEASELAAAVARFGDMVAANPPKPKSRGKLGPQLKPKPQWEESSEDEFVNTTQKLEEEGYAPPSAKTGIALEKVEARDEPQAAAATSEFEVASAQETAEFAAGTQAGSVSEEGFGTAATEIASGAAADFSVQAEPRVAAGNAAETSPKAAAAAAGAEFGGPGEKAQFPVGGLPAQSFEVAAPSEIKNSEPAAISPQIAAETASFGGVPEVASGPELSVTAESYAASAVDPAFDPDRTQWATQFATHFGVQEEEASEPPEAPASDKQEPEAAPASRDEIAAILSNLPGGMAGAEEPSQSEADAQSGPRPWPLEGPTAEAWKAEEVPVEDHDSSVSLAEEMEQAWAAVSPGQPAQPIVAEPEGQANRQEADLETVAEGREQESQPAPALEVAQPTSPEVSNTSGAEAGETQPASSEPAPEGKRAPAGHDRVSGVMQSAAMAIATRATVSAVASQLHQPAEDAGTGPSAIEELVGQVLDRLKPKLIAEIKRELDTTEKE